MASESIIYPQGDTASLREREEMFYPTASGSSSPVAAAAADVAAEAEVNQHRAGTSGIPGIYSIAQDSALDEWKDYSCSTAWEYFINDVDNAIGELVGADKCAAVGEEKQLAGEPRRRLQRPKRLVVPLTYKGRSYVLRRLKHGRKRDCRQADPPPAASLSPCPMEFPRLPRYIGEEERALDALLATGHQEEWASEQELVEGEEVYRLLASWFGLGDFFCLHESGSGMTKRSSTEYDGYTLSLEQLLSTGVLAMEDRRCGTVLALQKPPTGRRDSKKQGVSVKGYVVLSYPPSRGDSRWTRKAESIRLESATSSDLPPGRRSLEAFGELLEHKALASWGKRGEGGRLEASARYTWERHVFDDRVMEEGDREACQTEWRNHFWRERSHQRRGTRDRAYRALLAQAGGENGAPSWGHEKDPLESIRVTALYNGLGGDRPLPHAPLEMLDGGFLEGGEAMEWTASVSWEACASEENSSLGFKLRLMLAMYVHCLALDGDLLMSDLSGASTEVEPSPALERARHIGAVLGPSTRELIERMKRSLPLRDGDRSRVGEGGGRTGAEHAEIVRATRYLLTPRTTTPLSSFSHRERRESWIGGTRTGHRQQQHHQQQPKQQPPPSPSPTVVTETPGEEDESSPAPRTPTTPVLPTPDLSPQGFSPRAAGVNVGREGHDPSPSVKAEPVRERGVTPWLWVPRGGSPACRMVSLVALEAARFGAQGICLGDMAAFWKSFVEELRFLWEEGASVPSMDPEPSVDGYGMYDPANSGQNATPAAYFRKHVAPSVAATAAAAAAAGGRGAEMVEGGARSWGAGEGARPWSGSWGKIGMVGGGMVSPPLMPPQPDMRTSLLHQKLQMLNCCVAEQNRSRAFASLRNAYAGVVPSNGGGSGVGGTKLDAEGQRVGASSETSRYADGAAAGLDDGGRVGSAEGGMRENGVAVREGLSAIPGGSGKEGSSSGGGKGVAAVAETPEERSARMRATFAAERDAILRRVGVKKDVVTNGAGAGAGGGRPWGVTEQGRHRVAEKEEQREASSSSAPAPCTSPSFGGKAEDNARAQIGVDASAIDAHHREEKREGQHPTAAGDSGEGPSGAIDPSERRSEHPLPAPLQSAPSGGARRRAVQRVDSATRKVGRAVRAVRAVRRSVRRRSTRSIADESVDSVNGNGGGNQERSGLECVSGGDAGNGAEMATPTGEADAESRVWGAGGPGATGGGVDNSDSGTAAVTASAGADDCGGVDGGFYEAVDEAVDGASAGVRADDAAADVAFTGDRLLATGGRVVVPELLPACPLTSDMLEQQIELARRLRFRSESDGAKTEVYDTRVSRVRLATLAADMRCFLHANPEAVFADFLRWYSPQNWRPGSERRQARRAPGFGASTWAEATSSSGCGVAEPLEGASSSGKGGNLVLVNELVDDTSDDRGVENQRTPNEAAVVYLDEAASTSKPKLDGGSGAPPGWRVFVPKRPGLPRGEALDAPSSPSSSSSSSYPRCCRLNWGQQGEVVWRSAADVGDRGDDAGGIDQEEGVEWAETWVLEAESALSAGGDGEDERFSRQRPLFSPSQEAEKALHYLETISPAPLVSQLLLALACTAGFALSEAQTDASSLPCVRAAVSRVNAAIATASEGLSEASASGGVLLMDNRVAHPVSQGTLVACDALCDAVDKAEVLLSRGTSLIHKLPGERALVEALVTGDVANGCRTIPRQDTFASADGGRSGARSGDDGLGALVRYLSCGVPVYAFSMPANSALDGNASPPPNAGDQRRQLSRGDQLEAGEVHPPSDRRVDITPVEVAGGEEEVGTGNRGVSSSVEDDRGREVEVAAANSGASAQIETKVVLASIHTAETETPPKTSAPTSAPGGVLSFAPSVMPKERVREYSIRWWSPAVVSHRRACKGKEVMKAVSQEEEDEGIGARLYARVTVSGSKSDDGNDDGSEGGAADVRVAVSVAEPGRTC